MERPDDVKIREGRLLRKIEKLKVQRDHFKKELEYYQKVISMQPFLVDRFQTYEQKVAERKRVKDLDKRVEEQAKLIELLQKPQPNMRKPCVHCGQELMSDMTDSCYSCNQKRDT